MALTTGDIHTYSQNTNAFADITVGPDGAFYVGYKTGSSGIAVDVYDPATQTWTNFAGFSASDFGSVSLSDDLDLVFATDGHLHIVFKFDNGDGQSPFDEFRGVGYGEFDGTSWSFATVDQASNPNGWQNFDDPSLVIDGSGNAHVAYNFDDASSHDHFIKYATNADGTFQSEIRANFTEDTNSGINEIHRPILNMSADGTLHLTYLREDNVNSSTGNPFYQTKPSGLDWSDEVRLEGSAGAVNPNIYADTAVDSDGNVHLFYTSGGAVYDLNNTSGAFVSELAISAAVDANSVRGYQEVGGVEYVVVTDIDGNASLFERTGGTWSENMAVVAGERDTDVAINADGQVMLILTSATADRQIDFATGPLAVANPNPNVTDGSISISGASGTGGAFKIGDTVTTTWDNTAGGDDNADAISAVAVDFSAFGGGSAVAATNSSGMWTATYTISSGAIDSANRNVSVTATNSVGSTTQSDTTNATVDNVAPTVTDANVAISGGTGMGGVYFVGDTVSATWNNTAGGDNNTDTISGVTIDFSQFGGGAAIAATNSSGTWTATYTVVAGTLDATNRNVSVTVADNAGNTTTTADTTNATVDNEAPTVTDANVSISGGTGTGGAYIVGDTVTATWNNTAGGDNNSDTISGATVDFSQFGGGAAVAATNSSGTWTATYTVTAGTLDATNRNISVTVVDNAGNTTTRADTTNATVYNVAPTVTDANVSISGGTGTGGAYIVGDTVTATWNDTAGGDNNSDTILGATIDFSQFGGGAAVAATNSSGMWTATYTIVSGAIDTTNRNVSVTATNSAGSTTEVDTTNAKVDSIAPTVTDTNVEISGGTGAGGAYTVGDTVTATWNNTAGGDNNSDTISGATIDFSQFGGGTAVAATNSSGTWTATYTITAGTLDQAGRNVAITATDNAGNTTTTTDTTNAAVDNETPTVTDANLSISTGSGAGGTFIVGDTVTATWDNTSAGDNHADALSAVTVDFSAFGGGAAVTATEESGIWTAAYTITAGAIDAANRNVSVTVRDDAGNAAIVADSSNASVDTDVPTVDTVTVPANGTYARGETLSFAVAFDDTVTVDTSGGTPRLAIALNTGGTAYADYVSGSGSTALVYELQVASGQVDKDGIEITALEANGASLTDASGNATDLTLNGVADTSAVLIDAPAPSGGGGDENEDEDDGDTATTPTAAEVINATPPADGSPITITGEDGIDEVHIAGSVILGEGLENAVISGTGDYTVETNDLDNIVYGNVGDTTIYASAGRDFIDGGYGDNTVVFDGESSGYAVRIVEGVAQVTNMTTGDVTTIANVSLLQFADGEQPLFATGQGMVAGFYEAFLGRELDEAGFEYWMGQSASGMDAFEMVQHFVSPPEFGERTQSLTTSEFVEWLYVGFLDREPDATGMAYWIDAIENGTSYADAAANFVFADEVGIRIDELLDRNDWLHIV